MSLALSLLLPGCVQDRVAALDANIKSLKDTIEQLDAETERLEAALQGLPPPTAAVRVDNNPEGFDPERPLPAGDASQPDVILLSIDTLRADHLGTYGYERPTSPFFDRLAAEGIRFDSAWSPTSWTLPSHTTMLSGQLPVNHGVIDDHLKIPADVSLLQSTFRDGGYGTFGGVATLFVSSKFGFGRDFDRFEDFGIRDKKQNNLSTVDADHVFNHALHWAQEQPAGKPLFLFLHVYDVHYNYDAPAPWNEKFDRAPAWDDEVYQNYWAYKKKMISAVQLEHQIAQYDEEIAFVDDAFRQLIERWWGSGREVVIAVTADHGEEFGERGSWGHAHTLWPEQLHVPLIMHGGGLGPSVVDTRVGTEDIAPTMASLAGLSFQAPDGLDRAPELRGEAPDEQRVAAELADTSRFDSMVLRWHEWPYDLHIDVTHKMRALCNLEADPACATNIYRDNRGLGEELFGKLMGELGETWTANVAGSLEVADGYIFSENVRRNQNLDVEAGDTFAVIPGDASVKIHVGDEVLGPWRPLGGSVPGQGCPLSFSGRYITNASASLSAEEREYLISIGYLQPGEDEDPSDVPEDLRPPSGPTPCE